MYSIVQKLLQKLKLKSIYDIIPAETKIELINNNGEVNNEAHFENIIAQQLVANGFDHIGASEEIPWY